MVQKEDRHFLIGRLADVYGAVSALRRCVPVHLTGRDREAVGLFAIAVYSIAKASPRTMTVTR